MKGFYFGILTGAMSVMLLTSSCGSNLVISSKHCQIRDTIDFHKITTSVLRADVVDSFNNKDISRFNLNIRTHAFFGSTNPNSYSVSICPFLIENLRDQYVRDVTNEINNPREKDSIKELEITTFYSLKDVILGIIPIYSPRSINVTGLYYREIY
ncbi:MAG: hypothetical protein HQK51_04325 [Oligoflexia bacterium]|nr:hypothetical protein [Oligoflexia bacterium]